MRDTILFVDDDPHFLDGLRRTLRDHRHEWDIHCAQGAAVALDMVGQMPIDVIVTDMAMPEMDGFALLTALRTDPRTRNVPVIVLTGSGARDVKRRALDLGATDLLNKPLDAEDLIARLRSALRLKRSEDEIRRQNQALGQRVRERTQELEQSQVDIIWRLAKVAEFNDAETGNHVLRVGLCSREIARAMALSEGLADTLLLTAPLHDIGKVGVPDAILLKPGRLTTDEFAVMKRHTDIGAAVLQSDLQGRRLFHAWRDHRLSGSPFHENPLLAAAAGVARAHHEWWNGAGYPLGLRGNEIPIEAQIVALADVFDALCSKRPYKPALSLADARAIMHAERGTHFAPDAFDAFERALEGIVAIRAEFADEPDGAFRETFL